MTVSRLVARPLISAMFVVGATDALRRADARAARATPVTDRFVPLLQKAAPSGVTVPTDPKTLVRINAGLQIAAGLAFATGRAPRLSATVLAASLVPTTLAGHPFWAESDPGERTAQLQQFVKNAAVLGGLVIAAGDTEGKPGVAWRTRRAAKDARRQSRHLATSARREAKLAKAQLT